MIPMQQNLLLEALNRLSEHAASMTNLQSLLDMIVVETVKLLGVTSASFCDIWLEEGVVVVVAEYYTVAASEKERVSDKGVLYDLAEPWDDPQKRVDEGQTHYIYQVGELAHLPMEEAHLREYGIQSVLGVILQARGKPFAYIEAYESRYQRTFTEEDIQAMEAIARQVAPYIDNVRLYQQAQRELKERKQVEMELRQRNQELLTLQSISLMVTSSLDLNHILQILSRRMVQLFKVNSCELLSWDVAKNQIISFAKHVDASWVGEGQSAVYDLAEYPLTKRVLTDRIVVQMTISDPDIDPDERRYMKAAGIKTLLMVPMITQDKVIGLLALEDSNDESVFSAREIDFIQIFSNQAASAVQNARLYQRAQTEIEERIRTETMLKTYAERLEELVTQRTEALAETQAQLIERERLAILGQLAGGVAHELRNPLGVIANAIYFLQIYLQNSDETVEQYLQIIKDNMQGAEKLADDLLELTHTPVPQKESCLVKVLVRDALTAVSNMSDVIAIHTKLGADLPTVVVDGEQIVTSLIELLRNAIQAMPMGGTVHIIAFCRGTYVAIDVRDAGIGIPEEQLSRIFEPLFTTKAKGIGLGLAVAQKLVRANGGDIVVSSQVDKGSTFTLTLPAVV